MDKEYKNKIDSITLNAMETGVIDVKFDITTLNMIMAFIYKDSTLKTRKQLSNLNKLFKRLNKANYDNNPDLSRRVWIIEKLLSSILEYGIESNPEYLIQFIKDDPECTSLADRILDTIPTLKITYNESVILIKKLNDTLTYGTIKIARDLYIEVLNNCTDDFKSYKSVLNDLHEISIRIINIQRQYTNIASTQSLDLDNESFENAVIESVKKLSDRNRIFRTGIQLLNSILSPGFMSKRLYLFLAFPGKGKSTILLKIALDMRKYNPDIKAKDPTKIPTILFLTLENDIAETIERMFNMVVDSDDIRNYTGKQVYRMFKNEGDLELNDGNPVNICIKEYVNGSIDTNDLYDIINDLRDEGKEVIALIIDYIKRIKPAERAKDEKTELKNISNELKELAKFFDICVITAQQLNRSGATVVDAAIQSNKEDVTRLVGRDSIAGAWELMENSDWVCIINPEQQRDTGKKFMTFKRLKCRYRNSETDETKKKIEYFNQPFADDNDIKLLDDYDLDKPLGLYSLATDFDPVDEKRGKANAVVREKKGVKQEKIELVEEFDVFNSNRSTNF